ncbi:MAG: hypothetical protein Q8R47_01730 [Nanoarchaeota archaeon]|nr:hypothetical protein [Nanoarchaeota archaeon]
MKKSLYAGILSIFSFGCASQTTFLEYPVSVDKVKAIYIQQSDGDCYLKAPQEDNTELRIYDQYCDSIADSAAEASRQESFYSFKDRKDLDTETQRYLDALLQAAAEEIKQEKDIKIKFHYPHETLF